MNPQGYPPQGYPQVPQAYGPPQQPPPKKGMNGCLLAALIVGGLAIVAGALVAFFIFRAAKAITQAAEEGLNAPGSAELRAAGCDAAVILDMSKISSLFDAGATPGGTAGIVISCAVVAGHPSPTCDELAKTYVKTVGPTGKNILVEVEPKGGGQVQCKKVYGPNGTFLHDER
jgi:hypothetical protein